jgi:fructose-bisphosphate aldolase class II
MEQYAAYIRQVADGANVPVALLLDHASQLDSVMRALDCGFTSIMVDVSDKPLQENIAVTLKATKLCERYGASLESEIGHVPGLEADYDSSLQDDFSAHTDAEEARLFISETGVDALAISIGTAHGFYHGEPSLDFGRLHELREALDVPLVVHGASGLGHDDYYRCVEGGISKFNIHTDLTQAALDFVNKDGQDEKNYMEKCLGTAGAVEALAANLIHVFGSAGKA